MLSSCERAPSRSAACPQQGDVAKEPPRAERTDELTVTEDLSVARLGYIERVVGTTQYDRVLIGSDAHPPHRPGQLLDRDGRTRAQRRDPIAAVRSRTYGR
jgi:hypothetical protein